MNYNRPIIITLLAVLSLCVTTLARAEPAPVLPTTPPPANDPKPTPTNPPPGGLPTTAPNDPKLPSKWGKVKDNLKKIAKPNPYEIGVELGIMGLGALVDHLLDPANTSATHTPPLCEPGKSSYFDFANSVQGFGKPLMKSTSFLAYAKKAEGGEYNVRNMRNYGSVVDYYGRKAQNVEYEYTKKTVM